MLFCKKCILLSLALLGCYLLSAQKIIILKNEKILIPDRDFYVLKVTDSRTDTSLIGIASNKEKIVFGNSVASFLQNYFDLNLGKEYKRQRPVIIKVKKFIVGEENTYSEIASVAVQFDFYAEENGVWGKVYEAKSEVNESGSGIAASHEKRIRFIIYDCLKKFSLSEWKMKTPLPDHECNDAYFRNPTTLPAQEPDESEMDKLKPKNLNAVGFLLGGINIIGYEYEWRIHNYIGLTVGAGLFGAMAGIKIHTKPHRDSRFFSLSLQDCYFGYMDAIALEWGGRWVFKEKGRLGVTYQFGYGYIFSVNNDKLKNNRTNATTGGSLLFGIGLSW